MIKFTEKMVDDRIRLRRDVGEYCGDCYFWWARNKNGGECRVGAPILADDSTHNAIWPITAPFDWCGEFRHIMSILEPDSCESCDNIHCNERQGANENPEEEYNRASTIKQLKSSILDWKTNHLEEFSDIVKEIQGKNITDAYHMIRTAFLYEIPYFDNLTENTVTGEFIKLNKTIKSTT